MYNNRWQKTIDESSLAIGYFKLIYNNQNQAVDYMLLDINPSFERLTGWNIIEVTGKNVSEIIGESESTDFDWLSYYGSVVRSGKTQETTQWVERLKRYLNITVIPADNSSFALIIRDAADETINGYQLKDSDILPKDLDTIFNKTNDAI